MKKFILFFALILAFTLSTSAQFITNPDSKTISLKLPDYMLSLGFANSHDKLSVASQNGETPLGLKAASIQNNPFIKLYSYNGTPIWCLWANSSWYIIGPFLDTTRMGNLIIKQNKSWMRFNGYIKAKGFLEDSPKASKSYIDSIAALKRDNSDFYFSQPIIGNIYMRGKASFPGTSTRVAIYIPNVNMYGVQDVFCLTPFTNNNYTRPMAGDLLSYTIYPDSLIVFRQSGTVSSTTSSFTWLRIK